MSDEENQNDHRLMREFRFGDHTAFRVLWGRHYKWIWRISYTLCGSAADADDIAQDAFDRILRAADGYTEDASFRTWATRIVRNVAIDHARKRKRRNESEYQIVDIESTISDSRLTPESVLEQKFRKEQLRCVVDELGAHHRRIIILRFFGGMTLEEISWAERIPLGTVKSRLHVALKNLTSLMKGKNEEGE